jgi:predicted nucleotidyltransferase
MRLSELEKDALKFALEGIPGSFFLFGSRTSDTAKGGDIDILVYTKLPSYQTSKNIAVRFFSKCEEKIDVLVLDPEISNEQQKAFISEQKLIPLFNR